MVDKQSSSLVLPIIALSSFLGTFLISAVNIALPSIGLQFELSPVMLSWIVTAFLLSTAMFLLPVGRWADSKGIRKVYKIGIVLFTLATLLIPLSPSGSWMIGLRFLQGIGAAFMNTTGQAILVSGYPVQQRGRVLGISVSATYMGLAMGPFIGGYLTQYAGWPALFWLSGGVGIVVCFIAFRFLGRDLKPEEPTQRPHLRGVLFYMAGLTALVYGSARIPDSTGWILMVAGVVSIVLFIRFESKSQSPVIDIKLFTHNRLFGFSNLAALINYSATTAIVFFLSLYLQQVQGFQPRVAGLILVAQPIMMSLFSPLVGRLSDRVQPRYLASAGMAMCSVGLGAFALLGESTPVGVIVAILLWEGIGFALFSSPNMNTIMSSVEKRNLGVASGTAASMRVVGQIVSMTVVTLLFSLFFGEKLMNEVPNTQFLKAMKWGFTIFAALGFSGIYFSLNRGRLNR